MDNLFQEIDPTKISDNVFKLIDSDWMLITAGTPQHFNTMTASWGGMGVLWNRNVCFCVIRPSRYTHQFVEKAEAFSLSFFTEEYRAALNFCGAKSGRDVDKAGECGLTPVETSPGIMSFAQARLAFECKKIYFQDLDPIHFVDPTINRNYPNRDYHRMYIGEVLRCLVK